MENNEFGKFKLLVAEMSDIEEKLSVTYYKIVVMMLAKR